MANVDVCVLGAGPGGVTAALALAKSGINTLLVDAANFPRDKICGDALSGKVVGVLADLNPEILSRLKLEAVLPSGGVSFIAPSGQKLRVPFKSNGALPSAPGYTAKRVDFDNYLFQEAKKQGYIQVGEGVSFVNIQHQNDCVILSSADRTTEIRAKMVIVANGAQSEIARKLKRDSIRPRHYAAGIRGYYRGVSGLDNEHFVELHFLKRLLPGYFWIFPLPNGQANVGVVLRSDLIRKRRISLKQVLDEIIASESSIAPRFRSAQCLGAIKGFGLPLAAGLSKISGERFLLVGDAASLIDPFTGEGIGNAMISGIKAAEQAKECLESDRFDEKATAAYDKAVFAELGEEFRLSRKLQQLVQYPLLFNFLVKKANSNEQLQEMISCMFDDVTLRKKLKEPSFYLKLLF